MTYARIDYTGLKALVVGLGDTGLSCVRWLQDQGAEVRGTDTREMPPLVQSYSGQIVPDCLTLGRFDAADFAWADLIVISPGVALATPEVALAVNAGKDVIGDVELFAREIANDDSRVIAITGSNGKSTVTSLVGHLCQAAAMSTVMAGNIGLPVLDALSECDAKGRRPDIWVLELSSFQLETTMTLAPAAATILNLSEDHLDRYSGMAAYAAAKARIFQNAKVQIINRDDVPASALAQADRPTRSFGLAADTHEFGLLQNEGSLWLAEGAQPLLPVSELSIPGLHNAANALAALALCRAVDLAYEKLLPALKTFRGLPHRVEKIAEINGVIYYDDSKGTNVGATEAALKGFTQPVVLIAGGDGKGQDFSPLREAARNTRAVLLIGRDARLIEAALGPLVSVQRCETLENAVTVASKIAKPGDAVLLSPACASWDQFRNYVHRAEVFKSVVLSFAHEAEHVL